MRLQNFVSKPWAGAARMSFVIALGSCASAILAQSLSPAVNAHVDVQVAASSGRPAATDGHRMIRIIPAINGQAFIDIPLPEKVAITHATSASPSAYGNDTR
ncbi:hypothetical protein [Rhizorhabdus argentea]|uniref:hypothetical protein n=1 Tax=Rhizorhabdus argentea TaxID=1387174 RepID=UPI0030EBD06F